MRCMAASSAFLFFIVTAAGCSKSQSPVASPVGPSSVALEAKAGPPATVSLRVTVSNTDGQGNPSGITIQAGWTAGGSAAMHDTL